MLYTITISGLSYYHFYEFCLLVCKIIFLAQSPIAFMYLCI